MDSRAAPCGAGNSGGSPSGFSFFTHFSPLSNQQKQAAHEVLPGLFLGSAVAARSASWLHQNGITHILCLHNANASPAALQQQLREQLQQRREILKCNPEREPALLQQQQLRLQQLQRCQLASHLAVHPDRYVYCCCHAVDTPLELVLPILPSCIDFIDKALTDRNYRLHAPDQQQLAAAAAAAASGIPQQNVRLLQSRRRNHCFIEKREVVDSYAFPEDTLVQQGAAAAADTPAAAAAAASTKTVGGRVLVHCAKGISRSACIVLAYLMYRKSLRLEDALAFLCLKRPVYPNVGFQVQLQYLQERMEEVRPALPHAIDQQQQELQQQGAAAAAHALDAVAAIEKTEPDIFIRDPDARNRLRSFVASCSADLGQAELDSRITGRIRKECESIDDQVSLLYKKATLLQQRNIWRPYGLFFENLRSYQLQQDEDVLKRAEESAQRAAELKLVFAATLPGVSMADKVADEIKTWVSDCRAAEAEAAAAAAAAASGDKKRSSGEIPRDAAEASSDVKDRHSDKHKDRKSRRDRGREDKRSRRSTSSSSRESSSSERTCTENAQGTRNSSTPKHSLEHLRGGKRHRSSSRERDRDGERDKHRGGRDRVRDRGRDSSTERKKKKQRKAEKKEKKKKASLRLKLKTPKPKPEKKYSSDSE